MTKESSKVNHPLNKAETAFNKLGAPTAETCVPLNCAGGTESKLYKLTGCTDLQLHRYKTATNPDTGKPWLPLRRFAGIRGKWVSVAHAEALGEHIKALRAMQPATKGTTGK